MIHSFMLMLQRQWYYWKHRNDTPEQREVELQKCKAEMRVAIGNVREAFKDEPADRKLIETMNELNEVEETLELDKAS